MEQWVLEQETLLRGGFFFGVFLVVVLWEVLSPRRQLSYSKVVRWYANIGIIVLNQGVLRLVFPVLAASWAVSVQQKGWGLLNGLELSQGFKLLLALLFLDCAIYIQHVLFHSLPLLWKLHRMHHSDLDYDVTTGTRFHPIEIILSMGIKLAVISFLGPPVVAVIIFEILLNLGSMFNHGNIHIPSKIDSVLRFLVVTPDMHRVHHSVLSREYNRNFGFFLPWWDYLFGTYRAQPEAGHLEMTIGLNDFRERKELHLYRLLMQPFLSSRKDPSG